MRPPVASTERLASRGFLLFRPASDRHAAAAVAVRPRFALLAQCGRGLRCLRGAAAVCVACAVPPWLRPRLRFAPPPRFALSPPRSCRTHPPRILLARSHARGHPGGRAGGGCVAVGGCCVAVGVGVGCVVGCTGGCVGADGRTCHGGCLTESGRVGGLSDRYSGDSGRLRRQNRVFDEQP